MGWNREKTEPRGGMQTAALAPLLIPDVSSLEGELVNKERENKTRQRQGKAK